MTPLPPVLDGAVLPLPERMAAALDGELYALGGGHCPIDEIETPALRLAAVLAGFPPRLIAELGTAAWVWGATPVVPTRPELCVALGARARPQRAGPAHVREVVLFAADLTSLGGRRVTSPLRTAVDLARTRLELGDDEAALIRRLARIGGFGFDACRAALDSRKNLPDKRRALGRLSRILSPR